MEKYWKGLIDWIKDVMLREKNIDKEDLNLFFLVDSAKEAVDKIDIFYNKYLLKPNFKGLRKLLVLQNTNEIVYSMKNHIFLVITLFLSYSITFGQIPDPQYNNYNYLDSTKTIKAIITKKFQPKILFGMGEFNFKGDIEDTRNNGLIGRTGVHFGLSTNINDYFNLSIILQEGIVRVDGIKEESVPTNYPENFMSTLNSIGLYLDYNFKNFVFKKLVISPFLTTGINYLRFDSKGSNDETNDEYEINLAELWTLDPENEDKYSENTFGIPLGFELI